MSSILGAVSLIAGVGGLLQRTYLMQSNTPSGIPTILAVFDAILEENPEFSAEVTQHPVEQGPEISDHIQLKNPTLRLVGTISSSPLDLSSTIGNLIAGGVAAYTSSQFRENILNTALSAGTAIIGSKLLGNSADPLGSIFSGAADALARAVLQNVLTQRNPFSVMTKRQNYPNMVCEALRFPRDNKTGNQLAFEMDLVGIRIVSPSNTQLNRVSEDIITTAIPKTDLGGQSTTLISDQTAQQVSAANIPEVA